MIIYSVLESYCFINFCYGWYYKIRSGTQNDYALKLLCVVLLLSKVSVYVNNIIILCTMTA